MKKIHRFTAIFVVLSLLLGMVFITGCDAESGDDREDTARMQETNAESTPLEKIEKQLDRDLSFFVSYEYMHLAINGYSLETTQSFARDGSFYFHVESRQWDHRYLFEQKENVEWYYRYEDDDFVCYVKFDDEEATREVVSPDVRKAMETDKQKIIGFDALFPAYMENFTEVTPGEAYTFSMPMDKILKDDTFLSGFIKGVYTLHGSDYDPSLDLQIHCTCTVEKDTFKPLKIAYDFSELKPYVLSDGALSGEWALDMDLLYMYYEFDYDLPESIRVPDEFLNAA